MSKFENSNQISKNISNINQKSQIQSQLKLGEYFLTPLESFIINKQMPHGFKLESEENILKIAVLEQKDCKKTKKNKNLQKLPGIPYPRLNHKNVKKNENQQIKRRINKGLNIDNIPNDISREKYKIAKKCKIGMERIKDYPLANNFYEFNNVELPSLSKVEKKLNNYEYDSFYDFEMDIRRIWNYFFYEGEKGNKDIYEKTSKICEKWENICSELENYNVDMHESISNSILRRAERTKKEMLEYNDNNILNEKDKINNDKDIEKENIINGGIYNNNNCNKECEMTKEEKNMLGNLIRNNLNMSQLRGIAKFLMGKDDVKVLEFDIDKLSNEQLRKLEKYVNECVEENNSNANSNKKANNDKNKNKDNNINNSQINKGKENEIIYNNKNINNEENNDKTNNEKKENGIVNDNDKKESKKENGQVMNNENGNKNNIINDNNNNNKNKFPLSDSDSLSSDSSLSD